MRWIRVLGASALAVVALGAFSASGASAASVFLKAEGKFVSKGTKAGMFFFVGFPGEFCAQEQTGTLKSNGKPKDKASLATNAVDFCEIASTLGSFKSVEVAGTGKLSAKGRENVHGSRA